VGNISFLFYHFQLFDFYFKMDFKQSPLRSRDSDAGEIIWFILLILFDLFVGSPADAEKLQFPGFLTDEIPKRILVRFVQPDDLIFFVE
jgi:hypothetical protein